MTMAPERWKNAKITDIIGPPHLSMVKPSPMHRNVLTYGASHYYYKGTKELSLTKFVTATYAGVSVSLNK